MFNKSNEKETLNNNKLTRESEKFSKVLRSSDPQEYYEMFNSMDSDYLIVFLRKFHQKQSAANTKDLVDYLDDMLTRHVENN